MRLGDSAYFEISDAQGMATFSVMAESRGTTLLVAIDAAGERASHELRVLPGWVSLTPPLFAILVALTLRSVIPALLLGIWVGAAA